ncbi:hypothetical protein PUMCH_001719 [Australozyma saopauloensis]|uniref:Uncharacterized protein n=1 Tax=Australozyma saopauloensis TaxID=291208 RepID=A0AAX4H7A6_9ASCO|nr:hypothetical protein PUMCH_001719 [[Candida] saopauloensis]
MSRKRRSLDVSPFSHPWTDDFWSCHPPKCLDEWLILDISRAIRNKNGWEHKLNDPEIVAKWKAEIEEQKPQSHSFEEVFEYVLQELDWYRAQQEGDLSKSGFRYSINTYILYSDRAVSESTNQRLRILELKLEASTAKDYHPNSNDLVVDVVHPSLYPVVYGQTEEYKNGVLSKIEYTENIKCVKRRVLDFGVSQNFQWLPAKLVYDKDAGGFCFSSYINNLHPIDFADLYHEIENVFNSCLSGLTRCLSHCASDEYIRVEVPTYDDAYDEKYHEKREEIDELDLTLDQELEYDLLLEQMKPEFVKITIPLWKGGPAITPFDLTSFDHLKVIVKLANIELTPEKPRYDGGSWHVEGTINKDIVATILYYYDVENIQDSRLSFGESIDDPKADQGDEFYCQYYHGINNEDLMFKAAGSEETKNGRVIVFPNVFQHHVDAFELADKNKPGHRKVLCFFVVDPYNQLVKTSETVPPQQEEWIQDERIIEKYFPGASGLKSVSRDEALKNREKLMAERSLAVSTEIEEGYAAFYRKFALCEH